MANWFLWKDVYHGGTCANALPCHSKRVAVRLPLRFTRSWHVAGIPSVLAAAAAFFRKDGTSFLRGCFCAVLCWRWFWPMSLKLLFSMAAAVFLGDVGARARRRLPILRLYSTMPTCVWAPVVCGHDCRCGSALYSLLFTILVSVAAAVLAGPRWYSAQRTAFTTDTPSSADEQVASFSAICLSCWTGWMVLVLSKRISPRDLFTNMLPLRARCSRREVNLYDILDGDMVAGRHVVGFWLLGANAFSLVTGVSIFHPSKDVIFRERLPATICAGGTNLPLSLFYSNIMAHLLPPVGVATFLRRSRRFALRFCFCSRGGDGRRACCLPHSIPRGG